MGRESRVERKDLAKLSSVMVAAECLVTYVVELMYVCLLCYQS